MSESPPVVVPPSAPEPSGPPVDKRAWAERVLAEVLALLDIPARLELKDGPENGILVAVQLEGEVPGLPPGKRSSMVDALQFLANKIVNRPNTERRWISLGIGGFPEARPAPAERPPRAAAPSLASPAGTPSARPAPVPRSAAPVRATEPQDEYSSDLAPDGVLLALGKVVAAKSAAHGRYLALVGMRLPERASILKGAEGVVGVSAKAEGDGRNRRIVFAPDKPVPMPKRALPQDDVEDLDEE